jgi:hypothetical protein
LAYGQARCVQVHHSGDDFQASFGFIFVDFIPFPDCGQDFRQTEPGNPLIKPPFSPGFRGGVQVKPAFGMGENHGGHVPALHHHIQFPRDCPDKIVYHMPYGHISRKGGNKLVDFIGMEQGDHIFALQVHISVPVLNAGSCGIGQGRRLIQGIDMILDTT